MMQLMFFRWLLMEIYMLQAEQKAVTFPVIRQEQLAHPIMEVLMDLFAVSPIMVLPLSVPLILEPAVLTRSLVSSLTINGFPYVMGQTTGSWPDNNPARLFIVMQEANNLSQNCNPIFPLMFIPLCLVPVLLRLIFHRLLFWWTVVKMYIFPDGVDVLLETPDLYPSAGTTGLPVTPDAFKSPILTEKIFIFLY